MEDWRGGDATYGEASPEAAAERLTEGMEVDVKDELRSGEPT